MMMRCFRKHNHVTHYHHHQQHQKLDGDVTRTCKVWLLSLFFCFLVLASSVSASSTTIKQQQELSLAPRPKTVRSWSSICLERRSIKITKRRLLGYILYENRGSGNNLNDHGMIITRRRREKRRSTTTNTAFYVTPPTKQQFGTKHILRTSTTKYNNNGYYSSTNKRSTVIDIDSCDSNDSTNTDYIIPSGITVKIALDRNGGVADLSTPSTILQKRFTCNESLDMVHRLRCVSDAIIIGKNTVVMDNPSLTIRRNVTCHRCSWNNSSNNKSNNNSTTTHLPYQPLRVVLDPQLSLFENVLPTNDNSNETRIPNYTLFHDGLPTIVYYTSVTASEKDSKTQRYGNITFVSIPSIGSINSSSITRNECSSDNDDADGNNNATTSNTKLSNNNDRQNRSTTMLNVQAIVNDLYTNWNVKHIMIEGGPTTIQYFLHAATNDKHNLIDRLMIVHAPTVQFTNPCYSNITSDYILSFQQPNTKSDSSSFSFEQHNNHNTFQYLGTRPSGVDYIEYYCKVNQTWPTKELSDWP